MAMINCKECGKEISDQAKTCPHCGAPVNANNSKMKYIIIGSAAIIVILIIVLIISLNKKDNTDTASNTEPETTTEEVAEEPVEEVEEVDEEALAEARKEEALVNLYNYVKDNANKQNDGINYIEIGEENTKDNWIGLGVDGTHICLVRFYVDTEYDREYRTQIIIDKDFESANFDYRYIMRLMFSSTTRIGKGSIDLTKYKIGDQITVDTYTDPDDNNKEVDITPSNQSVLDSSVKKAFDSFINYLENHPEIDCTYDDLRLNIKKDTN